MDVGFPEWRKEKPMIKVKARYEGAVLIPEQPLDFPAGSELELSISQTPPQTRPIG